MGASLYRGNVPPSDPRAGQGVLEDKNARSADQPTPEANSYGVGSAARLKLRQQVADVRLDRLLAEKQRRADLAVHKTVGDELQDLELTGGRLLLELPRRRSRERDHRSRSTRTTTRCSRLESAAVVAVAVEDLLALCGVHVMGIGAWAAPL